MVYSQARVIVTHIKDSSTETFEDVQALEVNNTLMGKSGTFTIDLPFKRQGTDTEFSGKFKPGDTLKIYFKHSTSSDWGLVIDGDINSIDRKLTMEGVTYQVKGKDRTSNLLSQIWTFVYKYNDGNSPYTASDIIIDVVNQMQFEDGNKRVNAALTTNGGYVTPTTNEVVGNAGETDVTKRYFVQHDMKVNKWINLLSTNEFTGDGNYIYWVDTSNNLHWGPKPESFDSSLSEGEVASLSVDKDAEQMTSRLTINLGTNSAGTTRYTSHVIAEYVADVGYQEEYVTWKFLDTNVNAGMSDADALSDAIVKAKDKGELYMRNKAPSYIVQIPLIGTTNYNVGNLVTVISNTIGGQFVGEGHTMRIDEIRQRYNMKEGWMTWLILKEDLESRKASEI